jgi:hypothetical protein
MPRTTFNRRFTCQLDNPRCNPVCAWAAGTRAWLVGRRMPLRRAIPKKAPFQKRKPTALRGACGWDGWDRLKIIGWLEFQPCNGQCTLHQCLKNYSDFLHHTRLL